MKTTVNLHQFRDAFRSHGRQNTFSYEGLEVLFDYIESLEEDTGEETELDVVALCCEYAEEDFEDIANNYCIDLSDCEDEEEKIEAVEEYLNDNTMIVGRVGDSFIYAQF